MPPRRWFGAESSLLGFLGPSIHRQSAALVSDMFAAITALHPRGGARRSALLVGFLSQKEQFGLAAVDPWTQVGPVCWPWRWKSVHDEERVMREILRRGTWNPEPTRNSEL